MGCICFCFTGPRHEEEEEEEIVDDLRIRDSCFTYDRQLPCCSTLSNQIAESTNLQSTCQSHSSEEDVCPTCLEEYTEQNPRIIAKCTHHYHLGCIYDWMERSKTCPICNKETFVSRAKPINY